MSANRQAFWRQAHANKDNAGRRQREDFTSPEVRAEWLAHRHYWQQRQPWQDWQQ